MGNSERVDYKTRVKNRQENNSGKEKWKLAAYEILRLFTLLEHFPKIQAEH